MRASSAEGIVDSVSEGVVNATQTTADTLKQGFAAVDKATSFAADAYAKISPSLSKVTKAVSPIVEDAFEKTKPLASSLVSEVSRGTSNATSKVVSGASSALQDAGVSNDAIKSVESAVSGAYSTAKPLASSFVDFVAGADPITLFEYSAAAVAFSIAFPAISSAILRGLRGYAGNTSPAIVLDRLSTGSQVALVDIRSTREKEASGIPDMRDKSKYIQLEFATLEDGRLRRELKDIGSLEVTMTALQIAALKKVSKKTEIYIMDKNGSIGGSVARKVASKGFSKVHVVRGGFSAWLKYGLPIRMAESVGRVEVVSPSSVLFGSTKKSVSEGSRKQQQKALPPSQRKALPM